MLRVERLGPGVDTVKFTPLLAMPLTVTTTLPVVAPFGTGTVTLVALQLVGVATMPLKVTVLVPWLAPKFEPVMITGAPIAPEVGLREVIPGGRTVTANGTPLLASPPTVTTTFPEVALEGTGTTILVALQPVGDAATPLNVTVLVPWVAPKLEPEMVTEVPNGPDVGLRLEIPGPDAPLPLAALKAANAAPQMSEAASDALAEALPAAV
jgi:hypothetical protein